MNQLRFIRDVIYRLKRAYGQRVDIYHQSAESVNYQTGAKTVTKQKWSVRRVVVFTADMVRKHAYDLSYIAANKNFTYGGTFELGTRFFLFDGRDIPSDCAIEVENWYLIYDHARYEIKHLEKYPQSTAVFIHGVELKGAQLAEHVDICFEQHIGVDQSQEITP